MDDLRTDLQSYFDRAVKPVDLADIVDEMDYVIRPKSDTGKTRPWSWSGLRGLVAAAAVVLLVWGLVVMTGDGSQLVDDSRSPVDTVGPTVPEPSGVDTAGNLVFTYTWVAHRWESWGGFRLQKSAVGPQGAEGIVYWVTFPITDLASRCLIGGPGFERRDLDELADIASDAPGLTLVDGPEEVIVGGRRALYLRQQIAANEGCDPGYYYNWKAGEWGPMWLKYSVGDIIDLWLVDMPSDQGEVLVIVGLTDPTYAGLRDEIQEIVSSIVFTTE